MPANTRHPAVASFQPHNNNIKVWRYMDVIRLTAFMATRSLFFARADTLGDPFEGSLGLLNQMAREQMIDEMVKNQENDTPMGMRHTREEFRGMDAANNRALRHWAFISCWHSGESESMAMWRQYGATSGSIVIQSTYQRLSDAFRMNNSLNGNESENTEEDTDVYMGMVQYKDYSSPQDALALKGNVLPRFFHKRTAFEYEKEVRAVLWAPLSIPIDDSPSGFYLEVDVDQLVQTIRVRPGTPEWERLAIEAVIKKYGLGMKVAPSEIDATPMF